MLTVKMERVAIKYELDRMIVSEGMFHYYHAFSRLSDRERGKRRLESDGAADEGGDIE